MFKLNIKQVIMLNDNNFSKLLSSIMDIILELYSSDAYLSYKKADSLEKDGHYTQALKEYKKYLAIFPEDMEVYRKVALLYYLEGEHQKTYEFFCFSKIKEFKIDFSLITNFLDFLIEIDPINSSSYNKALLFSAFFNRFEKVMDKILALPYGSYDGIEIEAAYEKTYIWEYFCDVLDLSYEIEVVGLDLLDTIDIDILRVVDLAELERLNSITINTIEKAIKQAIINYNNDLRLIVSDNLKIMENL